MNLDELAQKYGGSQIQTGLSKFDELASKYGGAAVEQPPPAPVKDAGFSFGDIAKAFGVGAAGSTKALTDVAGAENVVSSKLGSAVESLQQSMTPERQAEMQRQAERMKAAEESGSTLQEVKAGALNVLEAPLQSTAQAIGSFVPYLLSTPIGLGLRLTGASKAVIAAVAKEAPRAIATAQGAGAVKGSIYDGVLQAEIEAGVDPELAKQKATAAQDYFGKNFDQIALGLGLGRVAGSTGVEKLLTPAGRVGAAQGMGRRIGEAVITESLPEAAQGGQERLAQNIALQREGRDVDTFRGVAGAATQEALTGALGAAPLAAIARPPAKPDASVEAFKKEEDAFRKQFGTAEPVAAPTETPPVAEPPTEFPGGYTATRREVSRQDVPESFGIFAEGSDKPLTTVTKQEEADAKLQSLSEIRQEEQARLLAESDKITKSIFDDQRKLEVMEATGQTDTDQYVQSKALLEQRKDEAAQQIKDIKEKIASYSAPLSAAPIGVRTDIQNEFNVSRGAEPVGTFSTLEQVEAMLRERDPEPFKQAEIAARKKELDNTLRPLITKFNLGDVGLNVVDQLERNAGGRYLDQLIEVSLEEANPLQTMRHESLHALKDLGFFTPQQWKALTERAEKDWIKQYMEGQTAEVEVDGKKQTMSRLDAYKQMGLTQEEIVEEAIADAFGAYDKGDTPPPGMIAALFKKLKDFFMNFGQALRGAGFESSEDIFQRVERGELKPRKQKAGKVEPKAEPAKPEVKPPVKAKKPAPSIAEPAKAPAGKEPVQPKPETITPETSRQSKIAKAKKPKEGKSSAVRRNIRYSLKTPTNAAFKKWSRGLDVIPSDNTESYEGGPAVFQAYHGTTHNQITEFKNIGNPEGALGQGPYMSTSIDDVNNNYAGVGPDLTNRIGREEDSVRDAFFDDAYTATDILEEYFADENIKEEVTDENFDELKDEYGDKAITHAATKRLKGESEGLVMPVFVRLEKPFNMADNPTYFELEYPQDEDGETNYEAEPSGSAVNLIEAINTVADQYSFDASSLTSWVYENASDGVSAREVFDRAAKDVGDIYGDSGEMISSGQFVQDVAREMGFDGLIQDADLYFGTQRKGFGGIRAGAMMGVRPGTLHIMPFNGKQVKSAIGNSGAYSDDSSDIRYSLRTNFPSVKEVKEAVAKAKVPKTEEFKRFIAGNQWVDEDGDPKVFYHATAREFVEFDPDLKVIYLSDTPEASEPFGKVAEDRLRQEIYQALNKKEKLDFFQRVVDDAVKADKMSEAEASDFIRKANRKIPDYGKFGDIDKEVMKALIDLSPTRMSIMPLYVRAETPFDFENKEHVAQVMEWVKQNVERKGDFADQTFNALKGSVVQGTPQAIEGEAVQKGIKRFGFDGYTLRKRGQQKSYAVYKPTQVKSVTGNLGEYDREAKDIRYSLPNIPANVQNRIDESVTKRVEKGFAQRMIEAISPRSAASFRAGALNRYNQLSEYDKKLAEQMGGPGLLADQSAESAALMSDLGAGIAASAMGYGDRNGGIPVLRNGITTIDTKVKGLIASLAPLAASGDSAIYQRYQYWAMVKRGQRLNSQGKITGIDTADVAFAKALEQKHPEFVSVQKDLIAFNNGLVKYMVDTGVLSQSRGAEYVKYADYVPFYRQMDGETTLGPNLFASLSGVKPPKKLKGAVIEEAPLADFLETMVRNTQSSIQAGIKNYAAQRTINVVTQVKAPGMGATRLNTPSTAPNTISVLEKGVLVSYETPDNLLVEAVKSLNMNELPFMGIIAGPANLLRSLVTRDPGFMMANLLRDSLSAYVTSGVKMTPIADTVMSFGKSLARKSTGFEALLNAGIIGGYEFSENIERSGRMLGEDLEKKTGTRKDAKVLRPFKSLWDALETGTTASDAATRAVIYDRVLAETGNEAEALYRALEVMNFHRKGNSALIRVLTAAVPFFNARLQGLDLFYRASTGNMNNKDAASIQRQFWARGMTMMALSAAYWFMVSDEEEYKKQEQETRDNNWLIPSLGIRIPIPFEVGVLFKTIPERIMAYSFGDDTGKDLRDSLFRNAMSTFAFNPIPQTVKPILEASFNFNTFTWRPIVSEGMKDIAPEYQVGPSTSIAAKGLAQALGLSPIKVDHIIKGYVGTMGMYGIDTIDMVLDQFGDSPKATKRFEQLPVIKRFALDKEARGNVTQYYELKDAVDTVVRTINLLEKTGESEEYVEYLTKNQGTFAFKDYIQDTEKTMKSLREMRTAIRTSQMGGDEKRDALLEISKAESAITSEIQTIKKAISSAQ
jgi:hypothetical protein